MKKLFSVAISRKVGLPPGSLVHVGEAMVIYFQRKKWL